MDAEPKSVPWPKNGWDEVVPGLFQGGQIRLAPPGSKFSDYSANHVVVKDEFDAVFSFYWTPEGWEGPAADIAHIHYPIPDGILTSEQLLKVRAIASDVAGCVRAGNRVLVRCQAGYNRSGLVTAFALMELDYNVHEAIELVRKARGDAALHRLVFLRYLMEAAGETS